MADDTEEQGLEILEVLAKIEDIGDFRLGEFMRQQGMNPNQPVIFYRQLIREAREVKSLIDIFEQNIDTDAKVIAKLKATLSAKDQENKRLRAEKNSLQGGSQQRIDKLEAENRQLKDIASQLQEDANSHNLLKEFLKGRMHPKTVEGLYRLFYNTHMAQLSAEVGRQPPPDASRLDKISRKLAEEFREVLQIPTDTLQEEREQLKKEMQELKKQKDALVEFIKRIYGGEGLA